MNKTEIQSRIEKCESEIASLKADLAKCDCADGIEQEKCWHSVNANGGVADVYAKTKQEATNFSCIGRPAYMPECRQVTAEDAALAYGLAALSYGLSAFNEPTSFAKELHKLGFRMKVAT